MIRKNSRSDIVTVILARACDHGPGEDCEDDWMIVDAHVRRGRVVERGWIGEGMSDAEWVRNHLIDNWPTCPMRCAFGDEVPPDVQAAEQLLVRGRVFGEWSPGYDSGPDYDEHFEIEDYRVLEVH